MDLVNKDGFVYFKICMSVYGLTQEDRIAFDHLVKLLKPHSYYLLCFTHGTWCHETLPTKFALFVDNFGIKCNNPVRTYHLVNTLQKYYTKSIN